MKISIATTTALFLSHTLSAAVAVADEQTNLEPQAFASGITLELGGNAPLYELSVPLAVYETVVRSDLGDLRVFNADGESVPHRVYRPDDDVRAEPVIEPVIFFPVTREQASEPSELRVELERFEGTTRIDLRRQHVYVPKSVEHAFYLIDAGEDNRPIRGVRLEWARAQETFLLEVRLESSDDLTQWTTASDRTTLAELHHETQVVRRNEISIGSNSNGHRYFRLSASNGLIPIDLLRVDVERVEEPVEAELTWSDALGVKVSNEISGEWQFTNPGRLPVSHVRVRPAVENALSGVVFFSTERTDTDDGAAWRSRGSGTVYRLRTGNDVVETTDVRLSSPSTDRHWKLAADERGLGTAPPEIALGYRPHMLWFLARGDGPFLLAFGSARAEPASEALLADVTEQMEGLTVSRDVRVEEIRVLGGAARLLAPTERDWAQWILWAVLSSATLCLLLMARRLWQQMGQAEEDVEEADGP